MIRKPKTYYRLLHVAPEAPAVDVYLNEELIVEDLTYGNFTPYINVAPGEYNLVIYPSGTSEKAVIKTDIVVPENKIYTIAVIGMNDNLELFPVEDPQNDLEEGKLGLRFGHLSPDAPAVDILLPSGKKLFKDVKYKEVTDYIEIPPGNYSISVVPTGTDTVVLTVPNIKLKEGRFYTIYAIGLVSGEIPYLQVVIPLDGNSYINV